MRQEIAVNLLNSETMAIASSTLNSKLLNLGTTSFFIKPMTLLWLLWIKINPHSHSRLTQAIVNNTS